jgi:hypothetical protein
VVHVLIALRDVGAAIQIEERLVQAGVDARWDTAAADAPPGSTAGTDEVDVVILGATELGPDLAPVADAWRALPGAPGVCAIGGPEARALAAAARCSLLSVNATAATFRSAIDEAMRLRFAGGLSWTLARRALGQPARSGDVDEVGLLINAARSMDLELARTALGWYAQHYVTDLGGIGALRAARALTIPEVEFAGRALDGTLSLQRALRAGSLEPAAAARLVWILASTGAIALTEEPLDAATPARRELTAVRDHLRGRSARLEGSTFFDVLEVTPAADDAEVERAYAQLAARYAPSVLGQHDLAGVAALVTPTWELIEKARAVLLDIAAKGRYLDWVRDRLATLKTTWAIDAAPARQAADAFARGQRAMADGDPHRAMSEFAAACRAHRGHPEYETNLAWARYRVAVTGGKDRAETAHAERTVAQAQLAGVRPWPRALLAMALLCAADGDSDAARFHLVEALRIDPNQPAAQQLLARLTAR